MTSPTLESLRWSAEKLMGFEKLIGLVASRGRNWHGKPFQYYQSPDGSIFVTVNNWQPHNNDDQMVLLLARVEALGLYDPFMVELYSQVCGFRLYNNQTLKDYDSAEDFSAYEIWKVLTATPAQKYAALEAIRSQVNSALEREKV